MSNPNYYQNVLYPFQDKTLSIIRSLDTGFYLTGGTAASRGYLNHRYSDDLDFFVNDDDRFRLWGDRIIQSLRQETGWECQIILREERFYRLNLLQAGVNLKLEWVNDVPARVGEPVNHPVLGKLDTAENILANKITALLDREEPKDLADIWGFCTRMGLSLQTAIEQADSKAAGVFPADLARLLCRATLKDWEMVRWVEAPDMNTYLNELKKLGESLLW